MDGNPDIDWNSILGELPRLDGRLAAARWPELSAAVLASPPRAIRCHPDRPIEELPFAVDPVAWFPTAMHVVGPDVRPGAFLHHAAGDYYVQDAGSTLAVALCQIRPGELVADLCAAPGGKSTAILELLRGAGWLMSNETIRSRFPVLEMALQRSGYSNFGTTHSDIAALTGDWAGRFDCVLVDAPCSGQSMVGKQRQSFSAFKASHIALNAARQRRILRAAGCLIRPGGRLVYSTCTFSVEENERVVECFLSEEQGWELISIPGFERWAVPGYPGCYRLWPHLDQVAGAFVAVLVKHADRSDVREWPHAVAAGEENSRRKQHHPRRHEKSRRPTSIDVLSRPPSVSWGSWSAIAREGLWWQEGQTLRYAPAEAASFHSVPSYRGFPVARRTSDGWLPTYGTARAAATLLADYEQCQLSDTDACRYVAGGTMLVDGLPDGWRIVHWRGRPLSWTKVVGGRLKNHFPKPLRQQATLALQ